MIFYFTMASTFSFGFSGDDIDIDESDLNDVQPQTAPNQNTDRALPALVEARRHDMREWVSLRSVYIFVYTGRAFLQAHFFTHRLISGNIALVIWLTLSVTNSPISNIIQQTLYHHTSK